MRARELGIAVGTGTPGRLNAMPGAETMVGRVGITAHALPAGDVAALVGGG
jgi:hypothetical protein